MNYWPLLLAPLVAWLSSDLWHERAYASARLSQLAALYEVGAELEALSHSPCPEARLHARAALRVYRNVNVEGARVGSVKLPEDAPRDAILFQTDWADQHLYPPGPSAESSSWAAARLAELLFDGGMSRTEIVRLLTESIE